MHEYGLEKSLEVKKKKTFEEENDIARDFASKVAEKETNETFRGKIDGEAWKRMYWSLFEKFYWQKLEEIENKK